MSYENPEKSALIKFEGSPNEPDKPEELNLWQRFKRAIWPWAREGGRLATRAKDLGDAYAEAEVAKSDSEAQKFAAEASEAAARADHQRQQTVEAVNEEIRRIFSDEEIPDEAKMLQFANLLANNPELRAQLDNIESLYAKLRVVHGLHITMQIGDEAKQIGASSGSSETDS